MDTNYGGLMLGVLLGVLLVGLAWKLKSWGPGGCLFRVFDVLASVAAFLVALFVVALMVATYWPAEKEVAIETTSMNYLPQPALQDDTVLKWLGKNRIGSLQWELPVRASEVCRDRKSGQPAKTGQGCVKANPFTILAIMTLETTRQGSWLGVNPTAPGITGKANVLEALVRRWNELADKRIAAWNRIAHQPGLMALYGSDLYEKAYGSVAGDVGLTQFQPDSYLAVMKDVIDANYDGKGPAANPWDPATAVEATARYMIATAGDDRAKQLYAYNHSAEYVARGMQIANNLEQSYLREVTMAVQGQPVSADQTVTKITVPDTPLIRALQFLEDLEDDLVDIVEVNHNLDQVRSVPFITGTNTLPGRVLELSSRFGETAEKLLPAVRNVRAFGVSWATYIYSPHEEVVAYLPLQASKAVPSQAPVAQNQPVAKTPVPQQVKPLIPNAPGAGIMSVGALIAPPLCGGQFARREVKDGRGATSSWGVHGNRPNRPGEYPGWLGTDFMSLSADKRVCAPISGSVIVSSDPTGGNYVYITGDGEYADLRVRVLHMSAAGRPVNGSRVEAGVLIGTISPNSGHVHVTVLDAKGRDIPIVYLLKNQGINVQSYKGGSYVDAFVPRDEELYFPK